MDKEYHNNEGKLVGKLEGTVYHKVVCRNKHLMRMFGGYGIDVDILEDLGMAGCEEIKITETDTGDILVCPFKTFDEHKILKDFAGPQYFIEGKYLEHG